jgi:hypothetical protein
MIQPRTDHTDQTVRPGAGLRWILCGLLLLMMAPLLGMPRFAMAAGAAQGTADLTGLADTTMGVSQLTADGVQCGLNLTNIGATAHQLVTDAGIAVRDDSTNRMTISAVTTRVGSDQCASAVLLGVYAKESFFSASAGWVQSGYVVLWQRSVMVATPISLHAAAVVDAARRLTDQMLIDWRTHNPPPGAAAAHSEMARPTGSQVATQTPTQVPTQVPPAAPKVTQ